MAKWLISKGHHCRVLLHQAETYGIHELYTYQGVEVFPPSRAQRGNDVECNLVRWAHVVLTHLEYTSWTIGMCNIYKRPCIQIVHNDSVYDVVECNPARMNIIYNSQWIADKLKYKHKSMVLVPPVDYRIQDLGLDTSIHPYITLINCNKNKGGVQFGQIAEAMPDRQFLAVKGSYDGHYAPDLPNIHTIENTPYIDQVYRQTRILVMPSKYESWGMTCTEAMANGIPVICTRTPGLVENTAGKMLYCDRDDIDGWVKAIKSLDKKATYQKYSAAGRERARELDPLEGYARLEEFLYTADKPLPDKPIDL